MYSTDSDPRLRIFGNILFSEGNEERDKRNTFLVSVKEKQAGRAACILVLNVLFVE